MVRTARAAADRRVTRVRWVFDARVSRGGDWGCAEMTAVAEVSGVAGVLEIGEVTVMYVSH
jgi:hypothetical protein